MGKLPAALLLVCLALPSSAATPESLFAAGRIASANGDTQKAIDLYEQAVKLRPNSSEYHFYLGSAYGRLAQQSGMLKAASLAKKSLAAMEKAVALDPNNIDARFGLISYYKIAPGFMGGDDEKALLQAAEVKKRDRLMGHRAYAVIHTADKKIDLARKEYVDAIREDPTNPKAHHYYGMFLTNQKQFDEAAKEFEAALAANPPFMPAHFRIGVISVVSRANWARGEQALKKYMTHTPLDNEPAIGDAWNVLGQLYEFSGRKAEARQAYLTAQKLQPQSKQIAEALKRLK
jgi:cytochrome c-type biogenesis protein CcmH/NrfG